MGRRIRSAAPAFSLAELIVSIGVLVLMLSLVGQVFHLTVKSTGQATALTEVTQTIRAFEQTLREDLRGVQPGRSVLVIQANHANAYWTQAERETAAGAPPGTGYPHASDPEREDSAGNLVPPRADVLLFYTGRKGASYLHPEVSSNLQQVVYGHAEPGEFVQGPGGMDFTGLGGPSSVTNPSPFFASAASTPVLTPAEQWHLARRATLLLPTPAEVGFTPADQFGVDPPLDQVSPASSPDTKYEALIQGKSDVIGSFDYADEVLRPFPAPPGTGDPSGGPWFLPKALNPILAATTPPAERAFARSQLDANPPPLLMNAQQKFYGMGHQMLPGCASFKVEWALDPKSEFVAGRLDGIGEMLWFDPGDQGDPAAGSAQRDPLRALVNKAAELKARMNAPGATTAQKNTLDAVIRRLDDLLTTPTCGEVDHTYFWTGFCTPNSPNSLPGMFYSLADRFRGLHDPNATNEAWDYPGGSETLAVFTANRPRWKKDSNGDPYPDFADTVPDPMFPGALRITIDVFDDNQRLDRPVRHVMVIPIGG